MNPEHVRHTGPRAEELESRRLLAATITNGVLVGTGTSGPDVVSIRRVLTDDVVLTLNGVAQTFDMDDFAGVRLEGLGGNDTFSLDHALVAGGVIRNTTVSGGAGEDTVSYASRSTSMCFTGYLAPDAATPVPYIAAYASFDDYPNVDRLLSDVEAVIGSLSGSGLGNGTGNSFNIDDTRLVPGSVLPAIRLEGGNGNDWFGSPETLDVTLVGGAGNDSFTLERDSDASVAGGAGDDNFHAIDDGPAFAAGPIQGRLDGGPGTDRIRVDARGSTSPITIRGLGGDDTLIGGEGADSIVGDAGSDSLIGNEGDDTLDGAPAQTRSPEGPATTPCSTARSPASGPRSSRWSTASSRLRRAPRRRGQRLPLRRP